MRPPLATVSMTQPYVLVFVMDAITNKPVFALTNYGIGALDSDTCKYANRTVPIRVTADEIVIKETKPTGLGAGLIRREASFTVKNGTPFNDTGISKLLYSAGATVDDFYFSIWVTDFSKSNEDIFKSGTFFGYYKLDSGLAWDEASCTTSIKLIDMLLMLNGRYNDNTSGAETILAGSEWQKLLSVPAYLGYRSKILAVGRTVSGIGGFDSYYKSVKAVISGIVQSNALSGTSMILGKSPTLAGIVGQTVKLKMGNGCIITGAITSLGGGEYGINTSGMVVNDKWGTIAVYNKGYTNPGTAIGVGTDKTNLQSVFLGDGVSLAQIPSPTMYLRSPGPVEFYNGGVVTSTGQMNVKLTGIADEANRELSCEEFKDPANTATRFTGVNVHFHETQQSASFTESALLHLNYATWLAPQQYQLFFSASSFVLADVQKEGMPWDLIVTTTVNAFVPLTYVYYARLIGNTSLLHSASGQYAIYADDGRSLVPLASAEITSIVYANDDFGMVDLCKITLKRRLKDINEAYDEASLYVDIGPPVYGGMVLEYIMASAGVSDSLLSNSFGVAGNQIGNTLSLAITNETWSELLDSVTFEAGLQIDAVNGVYHARPSFTKAKPYTWNRGISGERYLHILTDTSIGYGDVIDGTYKMDIGRTLTSLDAMRREYVRAHYTFSYIYAEYHGTQIRSLQSVKVPKNNDRIITYQFKHITDTANATAAAVQMTKLGHVANIGETTRMVEVGLPFSYMNIVAMDTITLRDFRHITALDEPLVAYSDDSATNPAYSYGKLGVAVRYDDETQYMLLPGVGVVSSISYNFTGNGPPITLQFKQVQHGTESNLRSVAEGLDLNTEVENLADGATSELHTSANYPKGMFSCPVDTSIQGVYISPGEYNPGSPVEMGCCNVSTTDANIYTDQEISVMCVGDFPNGSQWPHMCLTNNEVWYEAVDGNEIDSYESLLFKIFSFEPQGLLSVRVDGVVVSAMCVNYAPHLDWDGVANVWIGTVLVNPCVFDGATGYSRNIELVFTSRKCHSKRKPKLDENGVDLDPYLSDGVFDYEYEDIWTDVINAIAITVTLRAVSDLVIG